MTEHARVLFIDREPIRHSIRAALLKHGHKYNEALTSAAAVLAIGANQPDVILLAIDLPDVHGPEAVALLRPLTEAPLIAAIERKQEPYRRELLMAGADDVIAKPYHAKHLIALIRVAVRYSRLAPEPADRVIQTGPLTIMLATNRVYCDGLEIHVTPKELQLLITLARHQGAVVPNDQLLTEAWGATDSREARYLKAYMSQLRRKLKRDRSRAPFILTEPGVGYRLTAYR